jgi:hypothetical protein
MLKRIRAGLNDLGDSIPKVIADSVEDRTAALILRSVVKSSRDCNILISAFCQDDRDNSENVREIRDRPTLRALDLLAPMQV